MSAPFVLPRKAATPSPIPPSSSSHIPSIPSEPEHTEDSQLMADYLEYPRAYTPPAPYPPGTIGPPRPLEPRRSRASAQTHHSRQPSSGLSAVPVSGPGAGRISTATWISSSQFPPNRPVQTVTSDAYDDLDLSRPSGETHNYSYNAPAGGAHYDDGHTHEPYDAQDDEGYIPDHQQHGGPPSAPPTEAEHMTVEVASTSHHAPPQFNNTMPSQSQPKSGLGGMFRRAFGLGGGSSNPNAQPEDAEARRGYSHPFAPGLQQPTNSSKTRQVTYVDAPGTAVNDEYDDIDPGPASRPSAERARTHSSQHSMSDGGRSRSRPDNEDDEDLDELDGSTANAPHTLTAPRRPGPTPGPAMGTFMSSHRGPTDANGMPPGSPVYIEPLPTSDYDKMSAFASSPSELHSLLSYVDRVTQFVRDVHELPWMASRVAADYIPGDGARSRYARFRQRHVSGAVPVGGVNSWYATAAHQDLDLLDGASDAGWAAGNPAAIRHRQMMMQGSIGPNGVRLPPGYQNVAYVYPAAYPGQYNDPAGGYGRDSQDVDPYAPGLGQGEEGSEDVRVHVQNASGPPSVQGGATAHQVHAHFASSATGAPGSPRPGGPGPAQATAAHTFGSPAPGSQRSLAVMSDKSNSGKATTAGYETARTHGGGRTDGGRSEGGRSRGGGTELSAVTANTGTGTGTGTGSGLRAPGTGKGERKSRVSWYSTGSGGGDRGSRAESAVYGMGGLNMSPPGSPRASRGWYGQAQQEPRMGRVPEMSEVPSAAGGGGARVGLGFASEGGPRSPPRAVFAANLGSPRRRGFEPEMQRRGPALAAVR